MFTSLEAVMKNVIDITKILAERKLRRDLAIDYIRAAEAFIAERLVEETRQHLNADDPLANFFGCDDAD